MKAIIAFNWLRASSDQFVATHSSIRTVATREKCVALGLTAEYDRYDAAYALLDELYRRLRSNEQTATVAALDTERDTALMFLGHTVTAASYSSIKLVRDAAAHIRAVLDLYPNITRMELLAESGAVENLVRDLQSPAYAPHLTTLGLEEAVDNLNGTNEHLKTVYNQRAEAKSAADTRADLAAARKATAEAYAPIATALNGIYIGNYYGAKTPAVETNVGGMIDGINALLKQLDEVCTIEETRRANRPKEVSIHGTATAVVILHLPQGGTYKIVDIADKTIGEGISGGARIQISAPVGVYKAWINGKEWDKEITVK